MAKRGRPTNAERAKRAAEAVAATVPVPAKPAAEVPAVVQFCEKAGWPLESLKEFEDMGVYLAGKNRQGQYLRVKR